MKAVCLTITVAALISLAVGAAGNECGAVLTPEEAAVMLANQQAGLYETPAIAGAGWWYIPTTMHVVRRSNGTGGLPDSRLASALSDVNNAYAPAGMVFYRAGPTRYINNDGFYLNIDTRAEIDALRQTDVVPGTVNVYFTENLATENSGTICGISSFTSSAVQGIVIRNGCTAVSSNHSTVPHEYGHYFDLYHTHETMFGTERVLRTNCSSPPCPCYVNCTVAGDLLCDTPADPVLSDATVDSSCVYTGGERDMCENRLYVPDTRNFMSYSRATCRNAFTAQQNARSLATLQNLRAELASVSDACGAAIFVNGDFSNGGAGDAFFPFETFAEGAAAVPDYGCVIISGGDYAPAPIMINRPMTLHAPRGVVRIGG